MNAYVLTTSRVPRSELIQDMLDAVGNAEINTRKLWRDPKLKATWKESEALKGKKDYVTKEVDERNQTIIFNHLATKYPDTEKVGEELGQDKSSKMPSTGDTRWVLDPIDSTRNFISGTSDFSISLARQRFRGGQWHADGGKNAVAVRRDKASFFSGCNSRPATFAPAGSKRSGAGGNESAEAFDAKDRQAVARASRP